MVVKHPRGEHAHGLATVRGGFRLGFVHELPVFFFANNVAWALLSFPVLFCFCPILPVFVAYPVWWVQEYTEEFREIAPRSKKNLGGVADGNITLINQRSVCDDLPVCNTYPHPPLIEASQTIIICAIFFIFLILQIICRMTLYFYLLLQICVKCCCDFYFPDLVSA